MKTFFASLSKYYWDSIQKRSTLDNLISPSHWIASIIHFCDYAFERQGSPTIYRDSAKEAFIHNQSWLESLEHWSDDIETKLFEDFTRICRESFLENLNLKNNPMGPSNGRLISLIRFAWHETKNESITKWVLTSIQNNDLLNAFNTLRKIRGVGRKISSFYLRDIYCLSGSNDRNMRDRYLLQPIDVWTRRAARVLLGDKNASDASCADFLVQFEDRMEVASGLSNIAFWVLGSRIAENEKTFEEYLEAIKQGNRDTLRRLLTGKIDYERKWLTLLETVHDTL